MGVSLCILCSRVCASSGQLPELYALAGLLNALTGEIYSRRDETTGAWLHNTFATEILMKKKYLVYFGALWALIFLYPPSPVHAQAIAETSICDEAEAIIADLNTIYILGDSVSKKQCLAACESMYPKPRGPHNERLYNECKRQCNKYYPRSCDDIAKLCACWASDQRKMIQYEACMDLAFRFCTDGTAIN